MSYFWATIRHKWFVLLASYKIGLPFWRAIVHDLSKFTKAELPHYNRQFFGDKGDELGFAHAWLHHQNKNPHHWGHYLSSVGIVVGHEFTGEKASFGKVDTACNPLEIVGIVESTSFAFGDDVIDRCISGRYQQVACDSATISLCFKFIQEHSPESKIVMTRCIPDNCGPMQEAILPTVWQTLCSANYAKPSNTKSRPSLFAAFSVCLSLFSDSFRRLGSSSFSQHNMQPFQLLLPSCGQFPSTEPHVISLALDRIVGSVKDFSKYFRSIGGVFLSKNLLLLLCPGLCLSHNSCPPNNDCSANNQYCQEAKQYWLLPGIKLLPMPTVCVREMVADWMGASKAYTGSWDISEWLVSNLGKMRLHPETRARVRAELLRMGYVSPYPKRR